MGTVRGPGERLRLSAAALAGALLLAAACEHAQPFGAADLGPNEPFSTTFPRQLTLSALGDVDPAWLPDGSGIVYSFQLDRPDHDRCLGILPPEGGRQVRTICHVPLGDLDSTNALWSPAVGPGGALAYVRESSVPGALAPDSRELVVATLDLPDPGRAVLRFPYTASDGATLGTATYVQWIDGRSLVFLAQAVSYNTLVLPVDTLLTPIELIRVDLSGDSAIVTPVPGTRGASSVFVGASDTAYFTRAGDSTVYALNLAGGGPSVVYVFHGVGNVVDAQRRAGKLFAVAGYPPRFGAGGYVYQLDAAADSLVSLNPQDSVWYGRAAVAPSGTRVAAEGYGVTIRARCPAEGCPVDTIISPLAKLWLLQSP